MENNFFSGKYNGIVDGNIEYLKRLKNNGGIINNFDKNKYKDPDGIIETVVINGLPICLSTDGFFQ